MSVNIIKVECICGRALLTTELGDVWRVYLDRNGQPLIEHAERLTPNDLAMRIKDQKKNSKTLSCE